MSVLLSIGDLIVRNEEATGSIPVSSTIFLNHLARPILKMLFNMGFLLDQEWTSNWTRLLHLLGHVRLNTHSASQSRARITGRKFPSA